MDSLAKKIYLKIPRVTDVEADRVANIVKSEMQDHAKKVAIDWGLQVLIDHTVNFDEWYKEYFSDKT
jgi:hypothetical protein